MAAIKFNPMRPTGCIVCNAYHGSIYCEHNCKQNSGFLFDGVNGVVFCNAFINKTALYPIPKRTQKSHVRKFGGVWYQLVEHIEYLSEQGYFIQGDVFKEIGEI